MMLYDIMKCAANQLEQVINSHLRARPKRSFRWKSKPVKGAQRYMHTSILKTLKKAVRFIKGSAAVPRPSIMDDIRPVVLAKRLHTLQTCMQTHKSLSRWLETKPWKQCGSVASVTIINHVNRLL